MKLKKKLALAALALGLSVTAVRAYQDNPILGQLDSGRNHRHIEVLNADNVAHEVGDVLVWKDGTYDGIEVSSTTTANNGLVAGVVCEREMPANGVGFIQVQGYHSAITIGVANSAGDSLVTSTTGEAAGVYSVAQATGTASGQSQVNGVFAVALEATTSSTTVKGFIYR